MRIINIRINPDSRMLVINPPFNRVFIGLILTVRSIFGKEKEVMAFPTTVSQSNDKGQMLYMFFADDKGKSFSGKISMRLSQYCFSQELLGILKPNENETTKESMGAE